MEHILVERNEVRGLERGLQVARSPIGGVQSRRCELDRSRERESARESTRAREGKSGRVLERERYRPSD
jgi:hypothetical protein